jgi:hypothetical protein
MIYIHKLNDLNVKTAEIESVYVLREIKKNVTLPITIEHVSKFSSNYFPRHEDLAIIKDSIDRIQPMLDLVSEMFQSQNMVYEPINLKRTATLLTELRTYLTNNFNYLSSIISSKDQMIIDIVLTLNSIKVQRTSEDRTRQNQKLSEIFEKLLRNQEFMFNSFDIVNEGRVESSNGLYDGFTHGFLFKFTLEEELKRIDFAGIKPRIPYVELQRSDKIAKEMLEIKSGVKRTYDCNIKLVEFSAMLYSYIKLAKEQL